MKRRGPTNIGHHCWVTNITKRDILIGDLGARIPAFTTIDLLDDYHSVYSLEKVKQSLENGSLYTRIQSNQIKIRQTAPDSNPYRTISLSDVSFPHKARSTIKFEDKVFEELEFGDTMQEQEEFAAEMAESAIVDHAASIDLQNDNSNK